MQKKILVLVLGMGLGAAAGVFAQDEVRRVIHELRYSHRNVEEFEMSLGVTGQGSPTKPRPLVDAREVLKIPDYYGQLLEITADGDATIFWYQDPTGVIRNAVVTGASTRSVAIEIQPTRKLKVSLERGSSSGR